MLPSSPLPMKDATQQRACSCTLPLLLYCILIQRPNSAGVLSNDRCKVAYSAKAIALRMRRPRRRARRDAPSRRDARHVATRGQAGNRLTGRQCCQPVHAAAMSNQHVTAQQRRLPKPQQCRNSWHRPAPAPAGCPHRAHGSSGPSPAPGRLRPRGPGRASCGAPPRPCIRG